MLKKTIKQLITTACLTVLLTGCAGTASPDMAPVQTDPGTIAIPEQVQVIALGEAGHGVKEYQELKAEVFRTLVQNNGCRTFIIEGDFGNALKVDAYIHGGEGTAREAAATIGFRIYRTKEMADLPEWMRAYNETAPAREFMHFYGMDMQSTDNSKEYLFRVLEQVDPELAAEYEQIFAFLNDEEMFDINTEAFAGGIPEAEKLLQDVGQRKEQIAEACSLSTDISQEPTPRSTTVWANVWPTTWETVILPLVRMRGSPPSIPRQTKAFGQSRSKTKTA